MKNENMTKKSETTKWVGRQITVCLESGETLKGVISKIDDKNVWLKESATSKVKNLSKDEIKDIELED